MFLTVIVSEKAKKGRDKSYTESGTVSSLYLGTDLKEQAAHKGSVFIHRYG